MILSQLERTIISDKHYVCGFDQTPVDYLLACELMTLFYLFDFVLDKEKFPNVTRWWNTINCRTEIKDVQEMYYVRMDKIRDDVKKKR